MDRLSLFRRYYHDWLYCLRFFSRLPAPQGDGEVGPYDAARLPDAIYMAPAAGLTIGVLRATVLGVMLGLGLPSFLAAGLAVGAGVAASGAMHEDGLADVADGFGGGASVEGKLEIMRDSAIGAFGACALILSLLLRIGALAALAQHGALAAAVVLAAGAGVSRAACLAPLVLLPPARQDGAGRAVGTLPMTQAAAAFRLALLFAFAPALAGAGFGRCLVAAIVVSTGTLGVVALARWQIEGQTGDVAGATQQVAEILFLLVFAAGAGA